MKSWRGLCFVVLGSLVCVSFAAGPFKVTDLAPVMPHNGQRPTGLRIEEVKSSGAMALDMSHTPQGGTRTPACVTHTATGFGPYVYNRDIASANTSGQFLTNGDLVFGVRTSQSGGRLHQPDGSASPVPGIPGYDFVNARKINDAGVIVGHFSSFVTDPWDFRGGKPFYRRGSQTWTPYDDGSIMRVNNKGMALIQAGNFSGEIVTGLWSPETGPIHFSTLGSSLGSVYNDVDFRDLNEKNEVLTLGFNAQFDDVMRVHSATGSRDIALPLPSSDTNIVGLNIGGMNNLDQYSFGYRYREADGVFRNRWYLHSNGTWTDMTSSILSQLPAGTNLEQVNDIDDYGRVYGMATLADGSKTVLRIETVPEPTTLAALGLGALMLKRRTRRNGILRAS